MRRGVLTLFVLLAFAAPAQAAETLQPGAMLGTPIGYCTLGFAFDGTGAQAGKTYFVTAAHCFEDPGEDAQLGTPAYDYDDVPFGRLAFIGEADILVTDYAFIEVDPEDLYRVESWVAGHPQYPSGHSVFTETRLGDEIQFSGWGTGFEFTRPTRERRFGILTYDDPERFGVVGAQSFGDSGGPLVHIPTGKALGIESSLCIDICTDEGPTIEGILKKAAARGFGVQLRTAG